MLGLLFFPVCVCVVVTASVSFSNLSFLPSFRQRSSFGRAEPCRCVTAACSHVCFSDLSATVHSALAFPARKPFTYKSKQLFFFSVLDVLFVCLHVKQHVRSPFSSFRLSACVFFFFFAILFLCVFVLFAWSRKKKRGSYTIT